LISFSFSITFVCFKEISLLLRKIELLSDSISIDEEELFSPTYSDKLISTSLLLLLLLFMLL
jgi:hypothetical protein